MMRLFFLLAMMIISGCASLKEQSPGIYAAFSRYHEAVVAGEVLTRRAEFFTSTALQEIDISSESDAMELLLGSYIAVEQSHHEKVSPERGCLTINGYQANGSPVMLFIEYKLAGRNWLMNFTNVYLPQKEGFTGFINKALCPDELMGEILNAKANQGG